MKKDQKKASFGKGIAIGFGTIFTLIVIFFLFIIKVPSESKRNDTEMVESFMTDAFHLKKNDVKLSFSTFIKSEAGHYNVTLQLSPDYKKNDFLNDNLKKDKQTFYSPDSPKMRTGYQFGRDYNEDGQIIIALEDWMDAFGYDDERMDITYFAGKEIQQEMLQNPEQLKETTFGLIVTSPKGWGKYLRDYYPPGKVESPVLSKFSDDNDYFLLVHFSVTEIAEQENISLEADEQELINQLRNYFNLKNVPNGTYFELEFYGQSLHLQFNDGDFNELYQD